MQVQAMTQGDLERPVIWPPLPIIITDRHIMEMELRVRFLASRLVFSRFADRQEGEIAGAAHGSRQKQRK
jgi:hypothetical protein